MPFTLSHAGFVAPLRHYLSPRLLVALMAGSMAPDFGYFIRAFGLASFAHTFAGALWVSVPTGLLVYAIIIRFLPRLAAFLPNPHARFIAGSGIGRDDAKPPAMAVFAAVLAGALSHNLVDSFTHESGRAVGTFAILRQEALTLFGESYPVFRMLQYGGSLLGLAILFVTYHGSLRRYCQRHGERMWQDRRRWVRLFGLSAATIGIAAAANARILNGATSLYEVRAFFFEFLILWLPLFGVAFLACALSGRSPSPWTGKE